MENSPKYSLLEAKLKIEAWCAYQERCDQELRKKLRSWNMHYEDVDVLISDLISNNFLSEERFAEAFVSGKFRIKRWGKLKIKQHLKQKNISDYSIKKGLSQIDDDEYFETLEMLFTKKSEMVSGKTIWEKKAKIKRYLFNKGYESDLIYEVMKD